MGPIAHVYDVIARIITYTEPSAAFNLASTCKSWSDNALDVLWEDVDGKVFIVLGLSYPETRSYITDGPTPIDSLLWERFLRNCTRVHVFRNLSAERHTIHPDLQEKFRPLLAGRRLFPNLRALTLSNDCITDIFMSPSVTHFTWVHEDDIDVDETTLSATGDIIIASMPNLTTLSLICGVLDSIYDDVFSNIISRLPTLRTIIFPKNSLSPRLMCTLQNLPHLQRIELGRDGIAADPFYTGATQKSIQWLQTPFTMGRPGFPSLKAFAFCTPHLPIAQAVLAQEHFPLAQLREIDVIVNYPGPPSHDDRDVPAFIQPILDRCTHLVALSLDLRRYQAMSLVMETGEALGLHALLPILSLTSLRTLIIRHTLPLTLSDCDAETIARSLKEAEVICLNHQPMMLTPPLMTLRAVTAFARWCPNIHSLSIYVDGRQLHNPIDSASFSGHFRQLDLGSSPFPFDKPEYTWQCLAEFIASCLHEDALFLAGKDTNVLDCYVRIRSQVIKPQLTRQKHILSRYSQGWHTVRLMSKRFRRWVQEGVRDVEGSIL